MGWASKHSVFFLVYPRWECGQYNSFLRLRVPYRMERRVSWFLLDIRGFASDDGELDMYGGMMPSGRSVS